jgi:DNA polymerase-3 subunit gamma/tau
LKELDAMLQSGVEVGLLLDQLVGYFRDVMATAVGCGPDQLLYALPVQADEVAEVGRLLGLQTVLAIGQILDHTAARMRVSLHGRTLVEMAIVRICQLGDLDELANLVAELRGQQPAAETTRPMSGSISIAKKNADPRLATALTEDITNFGTEAALPMWESAPAVTSPLDADEGYRSGGMADQSQIATQAPERRIDSPYSKKVSGPQANGANAAILTEESVLAQWQSAISNGSQQPAHLPRPSRRDQLNEIAERPFVRLAMELFDVPCGQIRYSPPEGESS